ncbi:UNVERIFIED_CONTAM: hypothetical protein FKN15_031192 [Acipenser sinensis]
MKLAYWDIRGLAQPVRLLLEYTGTQYEEKLYSCGEDNPSMQCLVPRLACCFSSLVHRLACSDLRCIETLWSFPLGSQLPYLIDGDHKISQSNAIMRYIARKHSMCGETEEEMIRVDVLENQVMDFRNSFVMLCYGPDYEKRRPGYVLQLPAVLKQYSQFLGDRKWFAGENITFVDFIMYELLDQHQMFEPRCLDEFKNLKEFHCRFEELEKIAAFMKSKNFIKTPVNNKMAQWGGKKE